MKCSNPKCKKEAVEEGLCQDHYNFILAGREGNANAIKNIDNKKKGATNNE